MKRILAATDLSARSEAALQRALALARLTGAHLEIIHVIDDAWTDEQINARAGQARAALDVLAGSESASSGGISILIGVGQAYVEIIKRATDTGADLIVVGSHRHNGRDMFRGTTAERIIRLGRAPVLVVSKPAGNAYRRIVAGYDFSPHAKYALELCARWFPDADVHIVHALHVPFKGFLGAQTQDDIAGDEHRKALSRLDEDLAQLREKLAGQLPKVHLAIAEGLPVSVILHECENTAPDLIVIGTHGRSGLTHLVLGSVAEELIADAAIDVLAVKA